MQVYGTFTFDHKRSSAGIATYTPSSQLGSPALGDFSPTASRSVSASSLGPRSLLERIHEWLDTQEKTGAHRGFCIVAELEDRTSFKVIDIQDIAQYRQEKAQSGRKIWVNAFLPTENEMLTIQDAFKLHDLTVEDIWSPSEQSPEKKEAFEHYLYLVLNERQQRGFNHWEQVSVNVVLFDDGVLTIHTERLTCLPNVLYHFVYDNQTSMPPITPDWVLYKFTDAIVDRMVLDVSKMISETRAIDDMVLQVGLSGRREMFSRFTIARKTITELRTTLLSKKEIILSLIGETPINFVSVQMRAYLRDVHDHVILLQQKLELAAETLNTLQGVHLGMVSLEVAVGANEMNHIIKRFSAVATIVLPLTLVAGLFGMNVEVPGQFAEPLWLWFYVIVGAFALISIAMIMLFRYLEWL